MKRHIRRRPLIPIVSGGIGTLVCPQQAANAALKLTNSPLAKRTVGGSTACDVTMNSMRCVTRFR